MLLKAIAEIATRPVTLAPGGESANTHWLEATAEERATLTVAQVVTALEATAAALRAPRPALLYVWHDAPAGQLRCAITVRPADDLPFGGDYRVTGDLAEVVAAFLTADPAAAVPLELDLTVEDPSPVDDPPVPVWTYPVAVLLA